MSSMTISLPSTRGLRQDLIVPAGGNIDWTLSADQLNQRWWLIKNPGANEVTIARQTLPVTVTADALDTPIEADGQTLSISTTAEDVAFNFYNSGGSAITVNVFPFSPGSR